MLIQHIAINAPARPAWGLLVFQNIDVKSGLPGHQGKNALYAMCKRGVVLSGFFRKIFNVETSIE